MNFPTPDSSTMLWIFVVVTLLPGGALLVGDRVSAPARVGWLLACAAGWLVAAAIAATGAVGG